MCTSNSQKGGISFERHQYLAHEWTRHCNSAPLMELPVVEQSDSRNEESAQPGFENMSHCPYDHAANGIVNRFMRHP